MPTTTLSTVNPLVTARAATGLSRVALATVIGCSEAVIKWSEAGCYNIIPTCYKLWDDYLTASQVNQEYQAFRTVKRRNNFNTTTSTRTSKLTFPERAPGTMQGLLQHFGLKPYGFCMLACLQHGELFNLMQNRKVNLSSNFTAFFLGVGLSDEWIKDFNNNINATWKEEGCKLA